MSILDFHGTFYYNFANIMINRTVRNYEIKELIATGGMAAIYKAVQVSLDRVVAIKILHGHLAQDQNFITRFEREAKAAANLQHENIVNIIDFGKAEDVYFIAMEYVEGRSLKDLIASIKFIPIDIALMIAHSIIQGLAHAHKKGVVHRDIKPANILIDYNGIAKIADFGLAQAQDLTSVTVTGSIVGTPAYMSPEQAGGRKVDVRTDIFSLGVVLYEMITGTKPFSGENYSSVIHEILTVQPQKPIEANPLIPNELNDIILQMLEKDIDSRFQSVKDIGERIANSFKQRNIEISKEKIGEFLSTPNKEFDRLVKERKGKHLERALFYEKQGDDKIDSAIREYSKVLHLDPQDSKIRMRLRTLRERKKKLEPPPVKPAKPVEQKKTVPESAPAAMAKKRSSTLPVVLIISVVLVFAIVIGWRAIRRRRMQVLQQSSSGMIVITSVPESADIYIDGKKTGEVTPFTLDSLIAGDHSIEIKKRGYQPYVQAFTLEHDDTIAMDAVLLEETMQAQYGSIAITSSPNGAVVFLDGKRIGRTTPCTISDVAIGSHDIRLVKKGYDPVEVTRNVELDIETNVRVSMNKTKPDQEPPPAEPSFLKVTAKPWAKIYIDDRYVETTPIAKPIKVSAGAHMVKLENPSFKIWQQKITFNSGKTHSIDVRLEPKDGFLKLTVKPWADVYIDGKFMETTPIGSPIKLSAGRHILKLTNPSFKTYEHEIIIPVDKMLKKHVELEKK
jgi:serine/threonine protein kinase